jgi:tetratricopeptide (TPR) repeat protein
MKEAALSSIGRLIGIMLILVVAGIFVARAYYGNLNRSVDPRIQHARELYEQYDLYARSGDYYQIFDLLDSISEIYRSTPHYANSFELGVLHNNRAAAILTITLYHDSIPESSNPFLNLDTDSLLNRAAYEIESAISLYEEWNLRFDGREEEKIKEMIEEEFMNGLEQTYPELAEKYLNNRVKEIENSLVENQRRLSVCFTNLGLVYRQRGNYRKAIEQYEKAIELWDRNLDAENNLNKLLNRPLKKRNIIQKLFPPPKD